MDNSAPQEHARRVTGIFKRIAGVYDLLNSVLSLGFDARWRKILAEAAAPFPEKNSGRILDLAAGTMEVTVALAKRYPDHALLAMDFCLPMLAKGLPKLARFPNARILPLAGDGTRLPLADASVDAITLAFGLRNIQPREAAYAEALRVLVPGGRLCVLEFGSARDRILFGVYNFYLARVLPAVGALISKDKGAYRYLADTVAAFPSALELEEEMRRAGFAEVRHTPYTAGIVCLHTGVRPVRAATHTGS